MNVTFFQTADTERYRDLLLATSRTVGRYVQTRGYAQETFLGVKRGYWPWQASFNRIYIFEELVRRGWTDWAVYMDADAFIADLGFDLDAYLSGMADRAAVMAHSNATPHPWDVNSGVLMFNLRHPLGRRLVESWKAAFEAHLPDAALWALKEWSNPNDQQMLQEIILADPEIAGAVHLEPAQLFNAVDARFIRQIVREAIPDLAERTRVICGHVDAVLAADGPAARRGRLGLRRDKALRERRRAEAMVTQAFEALLRRPADPAAVHHYSEVILQLGAETGWRTVILQLMTSLEYQGRLARDPSTA